MDCYSLEDLEKGKITGVIIIASIFREEIAETLRGKGIFEFYFKEQWERERLRTAPEWNKIKEVMDSYGDEQGNREKS